MLKLYALAPNTHELNLGDMSSLDAVSRQLPQGLYSTFRTYANKTKVLGLAMHLLRLYNPLAGLAVQPAVSALELRTALRDVLKSFPAGELGTGEARVRISLATTESAGDVYIALEPLKAPDETVYERGVRVALSPVQRASPRLKTTAFIGHSTEARTAILKNELYEALMVRNGCILEGLTSNFYAVKAGKIITAMDGILLGVTRRYVLRLARLHGLGIEYRPPHVIELPGLDEAFITSSGRGVVPVTEIEGKPVANGQVGEIAKLLRRAYDEYVLQRAEKI
jgi:branched-chain amino acid aminotransferase